MHQCWDPAARAHFEASFRSEFGLPFMYPALQRDLQNQSGSSEPEFSDGSSQPDDAGQRAEPMQPSGQDGESDAMPQAEPDREWQLELATSQNNFAKRWDRMRRMESSDQDGDGEDDGSSTSTPRQEPTRGEGSSLLASMSSWSLASFVAHPCRSGQVSAEAQAQLVPGTNCRPTSTSSRPACSATWQDIMSYNWSSFEMDRLLRSSLMLRIFQALYVEHFALKDVPRARARRLADYEGCLKFLEGGFGIGTRPPKCRPPERDKQHQNHQHLRYAMSRKWQHRHNAAPKQAWRYRRGTPAGYTAIQALCSRISPGPRPFAPGKHPPRKGSYKP